MLQALLVRADAAGQLDWQISTDSTVSRVRQHGSNMTRQAAVHLPSHPGGPLELQEALPRERSITAVIGERADQRGRRLRRGPQGGRPVSYDTQRYKDRDVIERYYEKLKHWRGLATRDDKFAVIFRGGAILRSIVLWLRSPQGDTP